MRFYIVDLGPKRITMPEIKSGNLILQLVYLMLQTAAI